MVFGETSQEIGIIFATVYAKLMRGTPTDSTVDAKSLSNCISMIGIKSIVEGKMANISHRSRELDRLNVFNG